MSLKEKRIQNRKIGTPLVDFGIDTVAEFLAKNLCSLAITATTIVQLASTPESQLKK